ncbi:MAG: hypothetical protein ABIK92_20175, partial [Pseudomonadota bacterium]
ASFKTPHFGRSLRWAQISILEILNVFLRLKFSPALSLTKLKRFESGSVVSFFLTDFKPVCYMNGRSFIFINIVNVLSVFSHIGYYRTIYIR